MTATGRHFLVLHGDEFDSIVACGRLKNLAGVGAYGLLIWINHAVNYFRRKAGLPYWSLATHLKHRIKGASRFIRRFEDAVLSEAKRQNVDGIICGHVHRASIFQSEGLLYCNDGDWVESCTALVETYDGKLELIHWADNKHTIEDMRLDGNGARSEAA